MNGSVCRACFVQADSWEFVARIFVAGPQIDREVLLDRSEDFGPVYETFSRRLAIVPNFFFGRKFERFVKTFDLQTADFG